MTPPNAQTAVYRAALHRAGDAAEGSLAKAQELSRILKLQDDDIISAATFANARSWVDKARVCHAEAYAVYQILQAAAHPATPTDALYDLERAWHAWRLAEMLVPDGKADCGVQSNAVRQAEAIIKEMFRD